MICHTHKPTMIWLSHPYSHNDILHPYANNDLTITPIQTQWSDYNTHTATMIWLLHPYSHNDLLHPYSQNDLSHPYTNNDLTITPIQPQWAFTPIHQWSVCHTHTATMIWLSHPYSHNDLTIIPIQQQWCSYSPNNEPQFCVLLLASWCVHAIDKEGKITFKQKPQSTCTAAYII